MGGEGPQTRPQPQTTEHTEHTEPRHDDRKLAIAYGNEICHRLLEIPQASSA